MSIEKYLLQVKHNKEFYESICSQYPQQYFDWKITLLFYKAIHLLKALAVKENRGMGTTHNEIDKQINPKFCDNPLIANRAYSTYHNLYQYSRTARYDGIVDFDFFDELKKHDWIKAVEEYKSFAGYMESKRKIKIPD